MGGCYRMILDGFAGIKLDENKLSMFPVLPEGFNSYSFTITYRNVKLFVKVIKDGVYLKILGSNKTLNVEVYGQKIKLCFRCFWN